MKSMPYRALNRQHIEWKENSAFCGFGRALSAKRRFFVLLSSGQLVLREGTRKPDQKNTASLFSGSQLFSRRQRGHTEETLKLLAERLMAPLVH